MSSFEHLPLPVAAPAPWRLQGRGYILAVHLPAAFLDRHSFIPASLAGSRRGRLAYVMFVDYADSDTGPYHELLYIPGSFRFSDVRRLSITKIYVSTRDSVVNGQANWGIPKERCDFRVNYGDDGIDEIALARDGKVFAELKFRHRLFTLPFNGNLVPGPLRTLAQHFEGREFTYTPAASGHIKPATLLEARIDGSLFPDFSAGRVLACVKVTDFSMVFPEAVVRPLR
jgi:hypothetical protein